MRLNYLLTRFAFLLLVIWSAATINFFLPRISGQDPVRERIIKQMLLGASMQAGIEEMVETYNKKFGLDKPLWQQYLTYLNDLAHFDLNKSIALYPRDVTSIIADALPWTLGLLSVSTVLAVFLGSLFGALVAWSRSPRWLRMLSTPIFALSAIPYYLLGLVLLFIFAFGLKWLPGTGGYSIATIPSWSWSFAWDVLAHMTLPALSIILSAVGFWALGMRSMMITVEGEDFMTLAEAKGLKGFTLFFRYGLRNTLLPQATSLSLALGYVVSGSILVEVVFGVPGIGKTLFAAIKGVDFTVIQGIVFTIIVSLAVSTLILDLLLPVLDPRITYRKA